MKYQLYQSVDEMLVPKCLSKLTGDTISHVQQKAFNAESAKSGSHLVQVETNYGRGPQLILKRISLADDWIMRATDDQQGRSVMLWLSGLFDRLPSKIEHGILACASDGEGWAMLLHDFQTALLPHAQFSHEDNEHFLDAMAIYHATFWQVSELAEPSLGLCSLAQTYTALSPRTGHREVGGPHDHPRWILAGWDMLTDMVEPDVSQIITSLLADPEPLCTALASYPHTLIHGDYRQANLGLIRSTPTRTLILDWQLAAIAPASVDLVRYIGTNSALLPISKTAAITYYQQRLSHYLGNRFDEIAWQRQLKLGLLGGFLQEGWAIMLKATTWEEGAGAREHWQRDLQWWSEQVRQGVAEL